MRSQGNYGVGMLKEATERGGAGRERDREERERAWV